MAKVRYQLNGRDVTEEEFLQDAPGAALGEEVLTQPTKGYPFLNDAIGYHPKQVAEARKFLKSRGVPTDIREDGKVEIRDRGHYRDVLKAVGHHSRESFNGRC